MAVPSQGSAAAARAGVTAAAERAAERERQRARRLRDAVSERASVDPAGRLVVCDAMRRARRLPEDCHLVVFDTDTDAHMIRLELWSIRGVDLRSLDVRVCADHGDHFHVSLTGP